MARVVRPLVLGRGDVPQRRVPSDAVVEQLDVLEDRRPGLVAGGVPLVVDQLPLDPAEGALDRGVVPLFFIGDETSVVFFKLNPQFAARLGDPLELKALNMGRKADRKQFYDFCAEYDSELRRRNAIAVPTCLSEIDVLEALITASGGHIGRAARIIEVALPKALERGAVTMEPYDLSNAVRSYAIGLGWVDYDPFSVQPDPAQPVGEEGGVDA